MLFVTSLDNVTMVRGPYNALYKYTLNKKGDIHRASFIDIETASFFSLIIHYSSVFFNSFLSVNIFYLPRSSVFGAPVWSHLLVTTSNLLKFSN